MNIFVLYKMKGGKKKKEMKCPVCEKSYTRKANMQRHLLSHSDSKYKNEPSTSYAPGRHSLVPRKEKFECSVCSKIYVRKAFYERHKAKHVDENCFPFECDVCLQAFSQENILLSHKKTHNDMMPIHKCDYCPDTFIHLSGLNRHMLCHTSKKPLKCSMCNITFPDVMSRSRHIMNHGIFCGVCKISFKTLLEFKNHIIDVHKPKKSVEMSVLKKASKVSKTVVKNNQDKPVDGDQMPHSAPAPMDVLSEKGNELSSERVNNLVSEMPSCTFSCSVCNENFFNVSNLRKHQFMHVDKLHSCVSCKTILHDVIAYEHHVKTCSPCLLCVHCFVQFITVEEFENHCKKFNLTKSYPSQNVKITDTALSSSENSSLKANIERHWNRENNFVNSSGSFVSLNGNNSCVDTNFDYWIDWLVEFLALCKSVKKPFEMDLVSKIVQIHHILIKVCQNPCGAVKNRKILSVLLRIKDEFNHFHTLYCSHLGDQFLPPV